MRAEPAKVRDAATPLYKAGDMVICNFPYSAAPSKPGPEPHTVIYLGATRLPTGGVAAIVTYTTTQYSNRAEALPPDEVQVDPEVARSFGQKPFTAHAHKLAVVPFDRSFFPRIEDPPAFGKTGHAPRPVMDKVITAVDRARKPGATRPVEVYGPGTRIPPRVAQSRREHGAYR